MEMASGKEAAAHQHEEQEVWWFYLYIFCNVSLNEPHRQQNSNDIYCVFMSRYRYYNYLIYLKAMHTFIHILKYNVHE